MAGTPLFTFEDDFIDDVAFGFSDTDTIMIFERAFEDGRRVIEKAVRDRARANPDWAWMADELRVVWHRDGGVVVDYGGSIEDTVEALEYGLPGVPMQPVLRPALSNIAYGARKTIERGINGS